MRKVCEITDGCNKCIHSDVCDFYDGTKGRMPCDFTDSEIEALKEVAK